MSRNTRPGSRMQLFCYLRGECGFLCGVDNRDRPGVQLKTARPLQTGPSGLTSCTGLLVLFLILFLATDKKRGQERVAIHEILDPGDVLHREFHVP